MGYEVTFEDGYKNAKVEVDRDYSFDYGFTYDVDEIVDFINTEATSGKMEFWEGNGDFDDGEIDDYFEDEIVTLFTNADNTKVVKVKFRNARWKDETEYDFWADLAKKKAEIFGFRLSAKGDWYEKTLKVERVVVAD